MIFEGHAIDAIIFDLGGVILNIDYYLPVKSFRSLGVENFHEHYSQANQSGLFDKYETGKITSDEFLAEISGSVKAGTSSEAIMAAWNSILLDLPAERLELLRKAAGKHRTFLLSNTNEIHIRFVNAYLQQEYNLPSLDPLFEKVYLSYEIGLRKPHREVFDFVIRDAGLRPERTLFIDDSTQHVQGAKEAGLNSHHLTQPLIEFLEGKL